MIDPHTVMRLLGPTIEAVCVALQRHGAAMMLQASFPTMRVSARAAETSARVRVAASRGAVEVRIDGSSETLPLEALSKGLGCAALLARRSPASASGYTSLLLEGMPVWEEEMGAGGVLSAYRLTCPAVGIDLRGSAVSLGALAEAWALIDAHVDVLVGAAAVRALSFEGEPTPSF